MPANPLRLPKVGDRVRITRDLNGDPPGTETVIVSDIIKSRDGNAYHFRVKAMVRGNSYGKGTWAANSESVEYLDEEAPSNTQPVIFADYLEAAAGTTIDLVYKKHPDTTPYASIKVSANWQNLDNQKKAAAYTEEANAGPIFLAYRVGNSDAFGTLTLAEAKQVAVALFNQILYHETLLKEANPDD